MCSFRQLKCCALMGGSASGLVSKGIQPDREDSTRSDRVECSRWGGMFPMGWNVPDGVECWRNQAVEVPEVGFGVRGDGLLKVGHRARCRRSSSDAC